MQKVCEPYERQAKQGASFGYTKRRGYHPLLATRVLFRMVGRTTVLAAAVCAAGIITVVGTAADGAPAPFSLTARQAQEVGAFTGFIDAFNLRQLQPALGYLTADARVTDCDYKRVRTVQVSGKPAVKLWLSQRFKDRDTLLLGKVYNENADEPTGVLAVEFALRRSVTLRVLGYPNGIRPRLTAKVIFASTGKALIARFADGPLGGSPDVCRPQ